MFKYLVDLELIFFFFNLKENNKIRTNVLFT